VLGPPDDDGPPVRVGRDESPVPLEDASPVPPALVPPSDEPERSDERERSDELDRSEDLDPPVEPDASDELDASDEADWSDELDPSDARAAAAAPSPSWLFDVRAAELRSFFAQPEPLKWIVGGAKPFRTGPLPHEGHCVGPAASTPWITSNRCPHWVQT